MWMRILITTASIGITFGLWGTGCFTDDCELNPKLGCGSWKENETGGTGGTAEGGGGAGASGAMGGGGTGGAPECMTDVDCTDADEAQCDAGTCVPCTMSPQCEGVVGLPVCDGGTCIECMLGEEGACTGGETCDLLAKECVGVGPLSVGNCERCTNDTQCMGEHKCVPLDYPMGTLHGYYCLRPFPPACDKPFASPVMGKVSLSNAAADNYCGIVEDLTTCEAVRAFQDDWVCSGTDGMCSPDGVAAESAIPGALCRDIAGGAQADRCTYQCGSAGQCLDAVLDPPRSTCGGGAPMFCGGP